MEPVRLSLNLTVEDYRRGYMLMFRRRRTHLRTIVTLAIPLVALVYGWLVDAMLAGVIVTLILLAWTLWLVSFGDRFFSGVIARRRWNDTPLTREHRAYCISDKGVEVSLGGAPPTLMPWRVFVGVSRDAGGAILYEGPLQVRSFPRRLVAGADLDRIVQIAEAAGLKRI